METQGNYDKLEKKVHFVFHMHYCLLVSQYLGVTNKYLIN